MFTPITFVLEIFIPEVQIGTSHDGGINPSSLFRFGGIFLPVVGKFDSIRHVVTEIAFIFPLFAGGGTVLQKCSV